MPERLACPRPEDLIGSSRLRWMMRGGRERACGCGVGWVAFAFTGEAFIPLEEHPPARRFAEDVWIAAGLDTDCSLTFTFDRAYYKDGEFALRFCHAWREVAERAGYDTSGLTPLPPMRGTGGDHDHARA